MLGAILASFPAIAAPRHFAGLSLTKALRELESEGLALVYSSDLVRPDMRVSTEPAATAPRAILDELLAPHGLLALDGPRGRLLIVQAAPDAPAAPVPPRFHADEVVVTSSGDEAGVGAPPDGTTAIGGDQLRRDAAPGDDVNRALARQPGAAAADVSARLFLRGGEADEFSVRLDGMPIRNPFHLRGLQSPSGIIDTSVLAGAELSATSFPAEFGNSLSGVVNLTSLPPPDGTRYALSTSSMSTRLLSSGRFDAADGGWLVSARTWYPNAATDFVAPALEDFTPNFQDLFGKVQRRVGDSTILSADVLFSADDSDISQGTAQADHLHASSRYAWLDVKSALTPRLLSETLVSFTGIESERDGRVGSEPSPEASLHDDRSFAAFAARQDWSYQANEFHLMQAGVSVEHGTAAYDSVSLAASQGSLFGETSATPAAPVSLIASPSGNSFGAYVADRYRIAPSLTLDLGVRWDRQTWETGQPISPRVNVLWQPRPRTAVRAGWGRFTQAQGLDELRVEDGVRGFDPVEAAEQWSAGFEQAFARGLSFRLDAYSRSMSALRPRDENLFNPTEIFPEIAADRITIAPSAGQAHGVELSVRREPAHGIGWWASYARSEVQDRINGRWVPRAWNQRDAFNFGVDYRRQEWDLSVAGVAHTGWPTTGVTAVMVSGPDGSPTIQPIVGPLNAERLPDYFRLDLKVRRAFMVGQGRMAMFASITNLTNRQNVCCSTGFGFAPIGGGAVQVNREDAFWLGRTPVFGLEWESGP